MSFEDFIDTNLDPGLTNEQALLSDDLLYGTHFTDVTGKRIPPRYDFSWIDPANSPFWSFLKSVKDKASDA